MFGKLKTYTVHIKTDNNNNVQDIVFVEEGFSWKAFIFSILWTLFNRLWLASIILFIVYATIEILNNKGTVPVMSFALIKISIDVLLGFFADDILRAKLDRQGYVFYAIVAAESQAQAQLRFLERRDISELIFT